MEGEKEVLICVTGREIIVVKGCGFYPGTMDDGPNCRCSVEYYATEQDAKNALDSRSFTERDCVENKWCAGGRPCINRGGNEK